jgi:hypothetical protein
MTSELTPFDQMVSMVRAFAEFQNNLQKRVQQWLDENRDALVAFHHHLAADLAELERYRSEEEDEAFAILSQGGWVGMERHLTFSDIRGVVQLYKTHGETAMNQTIVLYFDKQDYALLVAMSADWARVPYLRDRQAIISDAVSAHKAGQFTLSIPALLPLAEGLAAEILGDTTTRAVQKVAADWKSREAEVWAQEFCNVVEQVIYKGYTFGKDPAPYLNRHGILHGRVPDYASAINSTRVLLLIDAIAELWHAKQTSLAPATIH